jgi:hypothetical protein
MYLHIGGGRELQLKDIIAISRYDATDVRLWKKMHRAGCLHDNGLSVPQTVIFTEDEAWFSDIAPLTLKKRAEGSIAAMKGK